MPAERTLTFRRETATLARQVMIRRLAEPDLSLDDVAREVAVSKRQLQRSFDAVESGGFLYELSRIRIAMAKRLLADNPEMTITQVVEAVGMRHRSNFARLFRQHVGMNPQRWRAEQKLVNA